ncbi:hypothetical protein GGX14DRAFT_633103 [Mycena pura]|uniref:G domain-containing protein n=1 Tax=Mycena pura TaxID=153505 RepID=A0AAD6VJS0_9AGAR|nr:hypothetical protein GGX14DRAFT_633103 [Mycena pura]
MVHENLPLATAKEILDKCPRLRILVVGKSGVGKSSLISYVFGVDTKSVSHVQRGECDVNKEIISEQNPRLVLHDSLGFEPGEGEHLETAKRFLESRTREDKALKDRVHVIWLCIQVPHAEGRVFETGDEVFLKLASAKKVPIVVVFTQFDILYNSIRRSLRANTPTEQIDKLCATNANENFKDLCIRPLERIKSELRYVRLSGLSGKPNSKPDRTALYDLIDLTRDLLKRDIEGEAWIVYAIAQRASAQVKINASIEVGMKGYWAGLASSTRFPGSTLKKCLDNVHADMTDSWNFYDPNDLLLGSDFKDKIKILTQLVTPDDEEVKSILRTWIGLVIGATVAAAAPAIGAIGLTAWFVKFITDIYRDTPKVLRCFMGYIVDLTLVLDQLFLVVVSFRPPRPLTSEDVETALENYKDSENFHLGEGLLTVSAFGVRDRDIVPSPSNQALFDATSSRIVGPVVDVSAFWNAIPGVRSVTNGSFTYFIYPCDTTLNFTIAFGGRRWPISDMDMNLGHTAANSSDWVGAPQDEEGRAQWLIGTPFLTNVYSSFRQIPPSIGFAELSTLAGGTGAANATTPDPGAKSNATSTFPVPAPTSRSNTINGPKKLTTRVIGAVVGGVIALLSLSILCFVISRHRTRRSRQAPNSSADVSGSVPPLVPFDLPSEQDRSRPKTQKKSEPAVSTAKAEAPQSSPDRETLDSTQGTSRVHQSRVPAGRSSVVSPTVTPQTGSAIGDPAIRRALETLREDMRSEMQQEMREVLRDVRWLALAERPVEGLPPEYASV